MEPIRVGSSGWVYKHWRGDFYPAELPQKRWFEHYSSHFDTLGRSCSAYFNNDIGGDAIHDALALKKKVEG